MLQIEELRKSLIYKINHIQDRDVLEVIQNLIVSTSIDSEVDNLSESQKKMLEMSEEDIKAGKLITQEDMDKRNLDWLDKL